MAEPHEEQELRALGMLEASLGVRQRVVAEDLVSKEAAQENLRDWLTVGRDIDQDVSEQRAARSRPRRDIPRGPWILLMALLVCAAGLCLALVLTEGL
ncbi:MAG: hypothetical protein QOJ90_672 [Actinomycetota bacterium]|jgi:hypothetical protein|nr:hypothetical protein [Actinomycetota bacterium]